jgi:hypothetical protein
MKKVKGKNAMVWIVRFFFKFMIGKGLPLKEVLIKR